MYTHKQALEEQRSIVAHSRPLNGYQRSVDVLSSIPVLRGDAVRGNAVQRRVVAAVYHHPLVWASLSSILDHAGLVNVLVVTTLLLRKTPPGTLYTDALLRTGDKTSQAILEHVCSHHGSPLGHHPLDVYIPIHHAFQRP